MEVNRLSSAGAYYNNADYSSRSEKSPTQPGQEAGKLPVDSAAAVYEPGNSGTDNTLGKTYSQDTETIARLKAEVDRRTENLRSLVEQLLLKQGYKFNDATDIYQLLREGKVEVDPETAAKAREEISEDGYWGVKQTSERVFSFAIALTGGDPSKAQAMKDAVIEGYEQAKKIWGGELPEICQKTYEETLKKFDEWIENNVK
ncbi:MULTISPECIES: hypothetical protein [Desulfitobacterium]|uniref:Uncharacterized protein n=1 Tax=Desulfitobacterium dehalogenans (strain ATCC 51507 / DSM 9161 / JW/IU-DC1) TaxID=756499 RepID=I4A7C7_DESDJ|nr:MULTISPECIES: hypothetical protein [Desulfitobacterium]AFL99861.1 hypothetical protein Desde_1442 [Desulfitobacterium dehalogenans ATCC 51507]